MTFTDEKEIRIEAIKRAIMEENRRKERRSGWISFNLWRAARVAVISIAFIVFMLAQAGFEWGTNITACVQALSQP